MKDLLRIKPEEKKKNRKNVVQVCIVRLSSEKRGMYLRKEKKKRAIRGNLWKVTFQLFFFASIVACLYIYIYAYMYIYTCIYACVYVHVYILFKHAGSAVEINKQLLVKKKKNEKKK